MSDVPTSSKSHCYFSNLASNWENYFLKHQSILNKLSYSSKSGFIGFFNIKLYMIEVIGVKIGLNTLVRGDGSYLELYYSDWRYTGS